MKHEELRVHGVSGTPPRKILYFDPVPYDLSATQTKVYGPQLDAEPYSTKAFHWGSLTSGHWSTAFWVLLVPFALANVAGWMIDKGKRTRGAVAIVRVAGMGITGLLAIQTSVILSDIGSGYVSRQGWPDWLSILGLWLETVFFVVLVLRFSVQSHFRSIPAHRRWGLLLGGRKSIEAEIRSEPMLGADIKREERIGLWDDPTSTATLLTPEMWKRHGILHRLRRAHLAFALAVGGLPLALMTGRWAIVYIVWPLLLVGSVIHLSYRPAKAWRGSYAPLWSIAINLAISLHVGVGGVDVPFDESPFVWAAVGVGALIAISVVLAMFRAGLTTVGTLVLGIVIGAAYGFTGGIIASHFVDESDQFLGPAGLLVVFWMLGALLSLILASAVILLRDARDRSSNGKKRGLELLRTVTGDPASLFRFIAHYGYVGILIGGALAIQSLQDIAPELGFLGSVDAVTAASNLILSYSVLVVLVLGWALYRQRWAGVGVTLVLTMLAYVVVINVADLPSVEILGLEFNLHTLQGVALVVIVFGPTLILLRSIFTGLLDPEKRRTGLGILWDVGSLWPRWFHPLGPIAYGPAAVTGLTGAIERCRRIARLRRYPPRESHTDSVPFEAHVIVAAHSQGAIVSVVAMGQMEDGDFRIEGDQAVSLITYGNPAGHLYSKLFTSVGIEELYADVATKLRGWCNLYRPSDPIGGEPAPDSGFPGKPGDVAVTRPEDGTGHSSYELTRAYRDTRSRVWRGDPCDPATRVD